MHATLFTSHATRPLIAPSILAADFAHMADHCRAALSAGADLLHLDVMDGHFVPNLTMGPDMCRWLRKALPDAFLDVHLMVKDPAAYVEPFAKAGANHLTFHVEVVPPGTVPSLIATIRSKGMSAGIAINPPTPVSAILPLVHMVDLSLVMSVNPGFGGQAFIPSVLEKVRAVKALQHSAQRLQMDGGINVHTARDCRQAGCDVLVAGSALFSLPRDQFTDVIHVLRAG